MATDSMLRPGELKDILLKEIEAADLGSMDVNDVGTVLEVKDGVARIYGLAARSRARCSSSPSRETGEIITGLVLNLEQDNVGAAIMGDYLKLKEGDEVRCTGRLLEVPVGPAMLGRVVDALGPADGRARADRGRVGRAGGVPGAGHHRAPAGEGAAADRHQGDRLDDPDRPRTARADHRRPRHRQDRHRDRHDHQSEGHRRHLRVRRDRAEALDRGDRGRAAQGRRRDGVHHRRGRVGVGSGAAAVHRALRRLRHRRVLHVRGGQGRRSACTTTSPSRPPRTGRCR